MNGAPMEAQEGSNQIRSSIDLTARVFTNSPARTAAFASQPIDR